MNTPVRSDGGVSGRYLSLVREEAGLTQAQLAKRLTFSPANVSRIESGDQKLTKEELRLLPPRDRDERGSPTGGVRHPGVG